MSNWMPRAASHCDRSENGTRHGEDNAGGKSYRSKNKNPTYNAICATVAMHQQTPRHSDEAIAIAIAMQRASEMNPTPLFRAELV
ncbi:hypothetical protein ZHAS_00011213 [Anopheles sinensis]|uniref:Uncharacterized protein n=1 Tax=Anopheles sinensis TaxID=74873 RepID=A0A084VZM1_ANOSI|nr:hypothetical protein ZHAS_00011213 [Anopheles sinensis]